MSLHCPGLGWRCEEAGGLGPYQEKKEEGRERSALGLVVLLFVMAAELGVACDVEKKWVCRISSER